jgi:hypothetical protein
MPTLTDLDAYSVWLHLRDDLRALHVLGFYLIYDLSTRKRRTEGSRFSQSNPYVYTAIGRILIAAPTRA